MQTDWGFACVIEVMGQRILFDTGANGDMLLANMSRLKIDPASIDDVFITHHHFDHVGGLSAFLNKNRDVTVYVPQSLRGVRQAKKVVHINNQPRQLHDGIFTTGELAGIEQSLVIQSAKGLALFVGCSHPEMSYILQAASQFGDIYAIIGGLHGFDQYELFADMKFICPTHCTRYLAEIKSRFPEVYVDGGVGQVINT